MTSQALPTPEEVAMQASVELLAIKLYEHEKYDHKLKDMDRPYSWIELHVEDRNEYRRLATELLATEHVQPGDKS